MLLFVCFLNVFGSSVVHGYNSGVLNAPQDVSHLVNISGIRINNAARKECNLFSSPKSFSHMKFSSGFCIDHSVVFQ